jgi:hypothetical protein
MGRVPSKISPPCILDGQNDTYLPVVKWKTRCEKCDVNGGFLYKGVLCTIRVLIAETTKYKLEGEKIPNKAKCICMYYIPSKRLLVTRGVFRQARSTGLEGGVSYIIYILSLYTGFY